MPILSVVTQPAANSLNAAYRPVVIRVKATRTDSDPVPPVVYCDVYFNGVYYKTHSKTQYNKLNTADSEWEFDIQDAAQEYLQKLLAPNGGALLIDAVPLISKVQCKFRSSGYDVNGFITPEGVAPIQGTDDSAPVSGTGTSFSQFFVLNTTLQHDDNQDLATHLATYKKRTWDTDAYPLTHRPDHYKIGTEQSDYFAFVDKLDRCPTAIVINYRNKGQSTFNTEQVSLPSPVCEAAITGINVVQVGTDAVIEWTYSGMPKDFRYRIDGGAWTVLTANSVTVASLSFAAHNVEVEPRCLCSSGTALTQEFTLVDPGACVPVAYGGSFSLPDAYEGIPYNIFITLTGTQPFALTVNSKPAWMTISIVDDKVYFTGTPDAPATDVEVDIDVSNCSDANTINLADTIDVVASGSSTCKGYTVTNEGVAEGAIVTYTNCAGFFDAVSLPLNATIELCAIEDSITPQVGVTIFHIIPNPC